MVSKELIKTQETGMKTMKLMGLQNVFSYSNFVHAFAGAIGSAVSMIIFYPLDTARTRLQVDDKRAAKHTHVVIAEIIKEEGFRSLYRGLFPVVTTLWCSNFVYFYTYSSLKAVVLGDVKSDPVKDLIFATVAGIVNVLVTAPLWVVNTRLKLQGVNLGNKDDDTKKSHYQGILDAIFKIAKFEGISSLWNGTRSSLVLTSNPAIHFMVYEALKRYFQRTLGIEELSGFLYFVLGAIAKSVATILTYPLQIIQSRSRASCHGNSEREDRIWKSMANLVRIQGLKGLYKGMESKLLQTVLTAAFMFMVYEKIAAAVFRIMGVEYLSVAKNK